MSTTITRADIAQTIFEEVGLSRTDSAYFVDSILDEMADAIAEEEALKISGFGSFVLRKKDERIGRNPKTGVEAPISSRTVMVFRASHVLKDLIANSNS